VITTATTQREKSSAMILLARMLLNAEEPLEAIKYSSTAFKLNPNGKLEWYLLHARLLGELKRDNERPEILRKGYQLTGSIVLRNAWIDSLLECKKYETALPIIEKELISSRLKSSWKLRRAKAYIGIGKINDAMNDLRMCLKELDQRIHPKKPDMTLIADRGMANALLGNIEAAKNDLSHLIHIGAEKWVTIHLNKAISLMENQ
jgi:tetratricopeptide (TPR) repeat protein